MSNVPERRSRSFIFKLICVLFIGLIGFVALEGAARLMGLGNPVLYYTDAWGGLRPLPNQKLTRLKGASVTVDANGYRTAVADQPGATRVLYLGDSVTWGGTSVDDSALFTEVAADALRKEGRAVYAMNAGVNATALLNQAEVFQGYEGKLDALVWLFPWGDTHRTYASGSQLWPARYRPKLALVEVIDHVIMKYWSRMLRDMPPPNENFLTADRPLGHDELFTKLIEQRKVRNLDAVRKVVAEVRRRNVPMVLGVTPTRKGDVLDPLPVEAVAFLNEMKGDGVAILDVSAAMAGSPEGVAACFLDHVHFSTEGHRAVGRALGAALEKSIGDFPE